MIRICSGPDLKGTMDQCDTTDRSHTMDQIPTMDQRFPMVERIMLDLIGLYAIGHAQALARYWRDPEYPGAMFPKEESLSRSCDYSTAESNLQSAFACLVTYGEDPVSYLRRAARSEIASDRERSGAFLLRVADDLEARLGGDPGSFPAI